jgi:hypothetical protein
MASMRSRTTTHFHVRENIRKTPAWPSFIGYVGVCFLGQDMEAWTGIQRFDRLDNDRLAWNGV